MMILTKQMITKKCDTNKNVTKINMIIIGVYYMRL
jgi:hypothetical protein